MPNTTERPSSSASTDPLRSRLPVSTATTRCTGLVWPSSASAIRGSHAAPSWAMITAVTTCWPCVLVVDTSPFAGQNGHLPGTTSCPRGGPAGAGTREQYATGYRPGRHSGRFSADRCHPGSQPPWPPGSYAARRSRELTDGDQLVARTSLNGPRGLQQAARPHPARAGTPARAGSSPSGRDGQTASRFIRRRSRSDSPPQMPKRSSCSSAYSRHSTRTSQPRQTFLASRVEPPFSGKKASGSVCAHKARSCQPGSVASSTPIPNPTDASGTMTSATVHLLPLRCPCPLPRNTENYTLEITPACLASRQAGYVVKAIFLTLMTGKSAQKPEAPASSRAVPALRKQASRGVRGNPLSQGCKTGRHAHHRAGRRSRGRAFPARAEG